MFCNRDKSLLTCDKQEVVNPFFLADYALEDHVIQTFYTLPENRCLARCNVNKRCRSVNYNRNLSSNHDCELNSATNQQYSKSYKQRPGWVYFENKVRTFLNLLIRYKDEKA